MNNKTYFLKKNMIDSHAHVHDPRFDGDREEVIVRAQEQGMSHIVTIGTNARTSRDALALAQKYDMIVATVGLHPLHLFAAADCEPEEQDVETFDYDYYLSLAQNEQVVAIGEVGLDYHHFGPDDDVDAITREQKRVFMRFIDICNAVHKPIVIHCWDGYADVLEILGAHPVERRGIIHSFIGSWKTAQKFIALGYKIGLNGIVTYGESYEKLMRNIDLVDVVIETDCPYLPPRPLPRDQRCEPKDVRLVAEKIAHVKGMNVDKVIAVTAENARAVFAISSQKSWKVESPES